jgi:hypothetical protein
MVEVEPDAGQGIAVMSAQRKSRPAVLTFGAVLFTFLFTFANVSCNGQRFASLSGAQLAFGTELPRSDMWGNKRQEKVRAEPLAGVGLIAAVIGLFLALIGQARRLAAIVAGAGAISLMMLISKLSRAATLQSGGMIDISPGFGVIAAIGLFFIAACVSWFGGKAPQTFTSPVPDKLPDPT